MPEDCVRDPVSPRHPVATQRYACYPGAARFATAFDVGAYVRALRVRTIVKSTLPFSVYVGGCMPRGLAGRATPNATVSDLAAVASARYRECLGREIEMVASYLARGTTLARLYCRADVANGEELIGLIRQAFALRADGDYTIDLDLSDSIAGRLAQLSGAGFNHLRLDARHGDHGAVHLYDAIQNAHRAGFNLVDIVCEAHAGQALARLPEIAHAGRHRVILAQDGNPSLSAGIEAGFAGATEALFETAGYVHLGMNHFVQAGDDLILARRRGRLNYDLRGYFIGTQHDCVGFGVAAVSRFGSVTCENQRSPSRYRAALARGRLPIRCGMVLSADDLVRRSVMHALICHLEVSFEAINIAYLIDFEQYFAPELARLEEFARLGMVELSGEWITVASKGLRVLPAICEVFDVYRNRTRPR